MTALRPWRRLLSRIVRVEYPSGSGLVAEYDDSEREEMRSLVLAAEEGRMPRAEAENACRLIHEAKVWADARIVPLAEQARAAGVHLEPAGSHFRIPDAVLAELARDAA